MINRVILEAVKNEKTAKMIAHKVLGNRSDVSYTQMLEMLAEGEVEYFVWLDGDNKEFFENALAELEKFEVGFRIVRTEPPAPSTQEEAPKPSDPSLPASSVQEETPKQPATRQPQPKKRPVFDFDFDKEINFFDDSLSPEKEKSNINHILVNAAIIVAVIAIITAVMLVIPSARSNQNIFTGAQSSRQSEQSRGQQAQRGQSAPTQSVANQGGGGAQNAQVAQAAQNAQFNEALENANRVCGTVGVFDVEKTYRFAISFNRQNLRAWLGLLECFEKTGESQKAGEIRGEMRQVFGEDVFTLMRIISPHGSLENLTTQGNVCRITYNRSNLQNAVHQELFAIASNLAGSCRRTVIFAQEGANVGYMISVDLSNLPKTLDEFQQKIEINSVGR